MNHLDQSFKRAQRIHDTQLPENWHEDLDREQRRREREEEEADRTEDEKDDNNT